MLQAYIFHFNNLQFAGVDYSGRSLSLTIVHVVVQYLCVFLLEGSSTKFG